MALSVTDCSLLNDMVSKLIASDILTINSLIEYPHGDDRIAIILGIEYKKWIELREKIIEHYSCQPVCAIDVIRQSRLDSSEPTLLSSGCENIDNLLDGGFESGTVVEFLGPPFSGKTTLAMQTAISTLYNSSGSVLYIDSVASSFSPERLMQLFLSRYLAESVLDSDDATRNVLSRIHVRQVFEFEDLMRLLRDLHSSSYSLKSESPLRIRLIVIDSLAPLIIIGKRRSKSIENDFSALALLFHLLKEIALSLDCLVIYTMSRKWSSGVGGLCSRIASSRIGADSAHLRLAFSTPRASTTIAPSELRMCSERTSTSTVDEKDVAAPLAVQALVPPVPDVQSSPAEPPLRFSYSQPPPPQHSSPPLFMGPPSETPDKSALDATIPQPPDGNEIGASLPLVASVTPLATAPDSSGKEKHVEHRSADSHQGSSTIVQLEICNSLRLKRGSCSICITNSGIE